MSDAEALARAIARSVLAAVLLGAGVAPPIGYLASSPSAKRRRNPKRATQAAQKRARKITRKASK